MKLKSKDQVIVITGKDKGKTGEIVKVFPKKGRVLVKGVNLYKRHVKSREGVEGGIIAIERALPISNVAIIDPTTKKPTRIAYKLLAKGGKIRVSAKTGADLDQPQTSAKSKETTKSKTSKQSK